MALKNVFGDLNLEKTQLSVLNSIQASKDFFGNQVVSERINQVEVPLDDLNWQDYVNIVSQHGTATQNNGQVEFSTGSNANGFFKSIAIDVVKYRPNSEIGFGFTFRFNGQSSPNSYQRIGVTGDLNWLNGVWIGYEGDSFQITYSNNGTIEQAIPRSNWKDPCDGSPDSKYTLNGVPVIADFTKAQLARVRAGLFGQAGFIFEIYTPDGEWLTVVSHSHVNTATTPVFSDFDLTIATEVNKTNSGTEILSIYSSCWAGWAGLSHKRLDDVITDRTLADVVRTVIEGKSSVGGGEYIPVKVNPSGSLEINLEDLILEVQKLSGEFSDDFSRVLEKRYKDVEEVRYDIPNDLLLANNSIYIGVAPDGSLTTDPVWIIIRHYFDNNRNPNRTRIRKAVAWDNRSIGW